MQQMSEKKNSVWVLLPIIAHKQFGQCFSFAFLDIPSVWKTCFGLVWRFLGFLNNFLKGTMTCGLQMIQCNVRQNMIQLLSGCLRGARVFLEDTCRKVKMQSYRAFLLGSKDASERRKG